MFKDKKGILCVTFDDFLVTDYSIALPIMREMGITGTSYLISGEPNYRWGQWDNAREATRLGWDIQCHSYGHINIKESTDEEILHSMIEADKAFVREGLKTPKHHAYPWGSGNIRGREIIKEFRVTQRNTGYDLNQINTYEDFNYHNIKALKADIGTNSNMQLIKDAIDIASENNSILVVYSHKIVKGDVENANQIKLSHFIEMLDYASDKLDIMNMSEVYNIVKFHRGEFNWI